MILDLPKRLLDRAVIAYWRRRKPVQVPGRTWSLALGDNVQQTMNLVMPLADDSPIALARLANAMSSMQDVLSAGLDNVGTVHVARFDVIDGHLCMVSVYDGDFATYIRDFIVTIGAVFDVLLDFIADPRPPRPVERNIDEFIDWVDDHDLLQIGNLLELAPRPGGRAEGGRAAVRPATERAAGGVPRLPRLHRRPDPARPRARMVSGVAGVDPANLQGWVVRGYTHPFVRHLVAGITDARATRRLIGAITGENPSLPQITTGAHWGSTPPSHTLNVGFTFPGLAALAVPDVRSGVVPVRLPRRRRGARGQDRRHRSVGTLPLARRARQGGRPRDLHDPRRRRGRARRRHRCAARRRARARWSRCHGSTGRRSPMASSTSATATASPSRGCRVSARMPSPTTSR